MIAELGNARMQGETFTNYRARRKLIAREVKTRLAGRMSFKSCDVVSYPTVGLDPALDTAIQKDVESGLLRDLVPLTMADGTIRRFGRTKGVTYRKYPRISGLKRRDHREIDRQYAA